MYEIGHINKRGDWDSAYGPYPTMEGAEAIMAMLSVSPIPGVTWEIRPLALT
jgi:hypothetical protein